MYDTYKLMNGFKKPNLSCLDLNELVEGFLQNKDNSMASNYFASIYCNLFPMILKIQKTFGNLTNEQKVEESLITLYRSILKYKTSNLAKFSTFFHNNFKRALITLTTQQNCQNRKVWNNIFYVDKADMERIINRKRSSASSYLSYLDELHMNDSLNKEEKLFCDAILNGFKTSKDIMNYFNITDIDLYDIKRNKPINKLITDNQIKNRFKKVRSKLREKIESGQVLF